ncbi:MAG: response regulator [Candidatus Omnitrophota bacterium]
MRGNILIISWSMAYSLTLQKILEREGFMTEICPSLKDLAGADKKFKYGAVFLDIDQYVVGGLSFIKGMKILRPATRVILTSETNFSNRDLLKKAILHGVYAFLRKPFNENKVLEVVAGLEIL